MERVNFIKISKLSYPQQTRSSADQNEEDKISNISKGGYLVQKDEDAELNIISSGSELQLAIQAAKDLDQSGIKVNVVSMPCLDRFLEADLEYQNKVIQKDLPSIVVEAAHPNSWYRILGRDDLVIGMTTFGSLHLQKCS